MGNEIVSQAATHTELLTGQPPGSVSGEATACTELPALPHTPRWARLQAQAVLSAWQIPPDTIQFAVLLVSELVTNAVAAMAGLAREPPGESAASVVLTLRRQPEHIVIEVSDSDPRPPVLVEAGADAESGRGLMLVDVISKEWSYFFSPGGKTVYCVLATDT